MKEEAPTKKLPPKMSGGNSSTPNTGTKAPNDEILSSLLRINYFDSISSIKDESLDIDLSACVTITSDSAMMINGNSLSTTDFWRVLDESAQNSQLELTTSSDESTTANAKQNNAIIKQETSTPSTFSGTFLRPEPPPPGQNNSFSPLKKIVKTLQQNEPPPQQQLLLPKKTTQQTRKQQQQHQTTNQRKTKQATTSNNNIINEQKKLIKQEPLDIQDNAVTSPLTLQHNNNTSANNVNNNLTKISPSKFKLFMLPTKNVEKPSTTITITPTTTTNIEKTATNKTTTENLDTPLIGSETSEDIADKKLFKCLNCDGMILQGLVERSTHELAGHHVLYRCNVCVRDFEQESSLKKHLKTHRAVETRKDAWKKCPDCGKW